MSQNTIMNVIPPCYLAAYDIETNQYHSYINWGNPAPYTGDAPGVYNVVRRYADEYADELQACDYLAGANIAEEVYNKSFAEISAMIEASTADRVERETAKDRLKMELDNILAAGRGGPLEVTAHHAEPYLATMLLMSWDQQDSKGNPAAWYQLPAAEYANKVKTCHAMTATNLREMDDIFKDMYNTAKQRKAPIVICIHNLSYEVNNCLKNLTCFRKWVAEGAVSFLSNNAKDSYKSIDVYAMRRGKRSRALLQIRDTWKLTGKSIKQIGKIHKYPKLDYTYNDIKDPAALTPHDYDYNRRDCELSLLAFRDAYIQAADLFEESGRVPVSANNIVSTISKSKFAAEFVKHKERVTGKGLSHLTAEQYSDYKPTTGGGLVGINPEFSFNIFEAGRLYECNRHALQVLGIGHIDLNSAHPSQVFKRLFPTSAPVAVPDDPAALAVIKRALESGRRMVEKMVTPEGIKKGFDIFETLLPDLKTGKTTKNKDIYKSGYAVFKIKNLELKTFEACGIPYTVPTLWSSKVITKVSGASTYELEDVHTPKTLNGSKIGSKIAEACEIDIKLTFEDFLTNVCLFYDFDSYEVSDVHLYSMGPASPYLYQQICYFGRKKIAYKQAVKAIEADDPDRLADALAREEYEQADAEAVRAEYAAKGREAKELAENLLKTAKGQFNGIYGTSYQSLFRDAAALAADGDGLEWISSQQYDNDNSAGIDVMQGSYIAQWSRVDIALYIRLLISLKAVPLYFATDSVYYLTTQETSKDLEAYIRGEYSYKKMYADGHPQRLPYNGQTKDLEKCRPNVPGLGGMDFEAPIEKIGYTQALKLIAAEQYTDKATGEIKTSRNVTFSGCGADVFFKSCETDADYFERLFREEGYVSAFETGKSKKVENLTEEEGYVIENVSFENNSLGSLQYVTTKEHCYTFIEA